MARNGISFDEKYKETRATFLPKEHVLPEGYYLIPRAQPRVKDSLQ